MIVKIKSRYTIQLNKLFNTDIEFDIEEFIKDNDIDIYSNYELESFIQDYINYHVNKDLLYDPEDLEDTDEYPELEFLNLDELVKQYSYLIKKRELKIVNCCDDAKFNEQNYCPECGKKISY